MVKLKRSEISAPVDLLAMFDAAPAAQRAYWTVPEDDFEFCALGCAFEAEADAGPDRFGTVQAALAELVGSLEFEIFDRGRREMLDANSEPAGFREQRVLPPTAVAGPGPLLLGGFAFSDLPEMARGHWAPFGGGRLTLPELLAVRQGERAWLIATPDADLALVEAAARAAPSGTTEATEDAAKIAERIALFDGEHRIDSSYPELVAQALDAIDRGAFEKVVTAREFRVNQQPDLVTVLRRLRHRFPTCATFAMSRGEHVFFGATPEVLVRSDDGVIRVDALAGTTRRDPDAERDAELVAALTSSKKETTEHALVVNDIRSTLEGAGVRLDPIGETQLMRLPHITHLHTPISGHAGADTTLFDLARGLHPTPALAGHPRRAAQDWLDRNEGLDRGWYGGPIGWTTLGGSGEYRVALRCALADSEAMTLYAGGGVVAGASPEAELAETATKLESLLGVLGPT